MKTYEIVTLQDVESSSFTNHILLTGKSGSGKSNALEYISENQYLFSNPKKKVVDIDVSDRLENCTYGLPEDDGELIADYRKHPDLVRNFQLKPMGFKSDVMMICGRGLQGYPSLPKNIKVVAFDPEHLTWDYLIYLLGKTEALIPTLNNIQATYGDDVNLKDIGDIFLRKQYRGERAYDMQVPKFLGNMIKNRYISWMQTGIFSDHPQVEKLKFEDILNDTDRITCFNSFLLQEEWEREIAVSLIVDMIIEAVRLRKVKSRVVLTLREVSDHVHWKLCRDSIMKILRKGRYIGLAGIDLIADTQRSLDLEPTFRRQFGVHMQMKSDFADAEKILEVQSVDEATLNKLSKLSPGQTLLASGMEYHYPVEFPPSRHKHASPTFDSLAFLTKTYGSRTYDVDGIFDKSQWRKYLQAHWVDLEAAKELQDDDDDDD